MVRSTNGTEASLITPALAAGQVQPPRFNDCQYCARNGSQAGQPFNNDNMARCSVWQCERRPNFER